MDKGVSEPLYGNYRAKVINNKDKSQFGRVLVWIPDLMPFLDSTKDGIWARPANNPIGGRNSEGGEDNHYAGTSYIPLKDSWTWVFFEAGNINRPYYFGALDIENTKVLPENQLGSSYQHKYTVLKTHSGRTIVVSDDPDDARVEITGKKRTITNPPSGDTDSVYQIDGNMTTILFDERLEQQKILIRTYKGDFVHIDIDSQKLQARFESDIIIKTNGKLQLTAQDDIDIKSIVGDIKIESESGTLDVKTADTTKHYAGGDMNLYSKKNYSYRGEVNVNGSAGGDMNHDAAGTLYEQSGKASSPSQASGAETADPKGERDT